MAESNKQGASRIRIETIHKVYARALVELALEQGVLAEVAEQMQQLAQVVEAQPKIILLFGAPTLTQEQREQVLVHVFKDRIHDLTYRFLRLLNRKGILGIAPGMILAFHDVYGEQYGVMEVDAYVAQPLNASKRQAVTDAVRALAGRDVALHVHVQEELIGGLRLRIGDQLIDATVANRLKRLRQEILVAGRQQARAELEKLIL